MSNLFSFKKKYIWNKVSRILESKLSKSEFNTWFSQVTLKKLDNNSAVIKVPNKFIANWLHDKYLTEINRSFKKIFNYSPDIHFTYDHPVNSSKTTKPHLAKRSDLYPRTNINSSMTFSQFITGSCNRFSCSSALEVAERPANYYNPLYIYSNIGLGKTHLLHAIGNHVLSKDPLSRIMYLSSNTLTSAFTYSVKNKRLYEFRERYCDLDLLLFDDIQLLTNRKKTQEEFLFIFNYLYGEKKQIVVTGNKPPNKLRNIDTNLTSRLGWGLLTEIKMPDHNTKISIIKHIAKENNINIQDDVIFFLSNSNSNIKTIIKNLVRLEAYSSLNNREINISVAKSLINNIIKPEIGVEDIKSITAGYFDISLSELVSKKRKRAYSYPRQLAMYLCRKHTDLSFQKIGDSFGHKDHSTAIYAVRRIEKHKKNETGILDDINKIENLLR